MKKSKLLKTISFSSLALLMGIAGTMAFAPIGTTTTPIANANEISTESGGLITPKKDDPVIYTTESGLNIKFGNAINGLSAAGGGNETSAFDNYNPLSSGNLSGFAYFTTTDGTNTYTWVIIGQNLTNPSNLPITKEIDYQKLSYWQTNKAKTETYKNFFDNTYEATTPAGLAIKNNNTLNDYSALRIHSYVAITNTKYQTEIPEGCVLCFANAKVAMSKFGSSGAYNGSTLHNLVAGYYTNSSLGISSIKSLIQPVTLKQSHRNSESTITNQYMYPLGGNNFNWGTYITTAQAKLPDSASWWTRGGHGNYNDRAGAYVDGTPYSSTYDWTGNSYGVRPAFCLKIT